MTQTEVARGRCGHCGKRDHAPSDCPNRTKCKHGTLVDGPETGNPPCWRCEVEPYRTGPK